MSELEPPVPRKERRAHKRPLPLPEVKFVPAGNPSLPTFVSLMLMITTFMIVLTSISLHENSRMRALITGVKQTFALTAGNGQSAEAGNAETLGAAAKGFRTALPMTEVAGESGGNRLILKLPFAVALDTTTKQATAEMENALAALAAALDKLPPDTGYEVELRFGDAELSDAYASALAQAAGNRGLAPARLFIGNLSGDKESLSLLVKLSPQAGTAPEAP